MALIHDEALIIMRSNRKVMKHMINLFIVEAYFAREYLSTNKKSRKMLRKMFRIILFEFMSKMTESIKNELLNRIPHENKT